MGDMFIKKSSLEDLCVTDGLGQRDSKTKVAECK